MVRRSLRSTLFPYTTLFRSDRVEAEGGELLRHGLHVHDLRRPTVGLDLVVVDEDDEIAEPVVRGRHGRLPDLSLLDRKSTRLNSSHVEISYAVFCLKKKRLM